ncbi:hypothetical protein BDD12DRAFT_888149 [Trichophaea hybrida]|nr:hypothetical protein BDD12DRAFT_888149 [Trichophaea hybrida]
MAEVRPEYTGESYHQCPSRFQLARHFRAMALRGISSPEKGFLAIQIAVATSPALSVPETSRTQRVRKAATIGLFIQWHESDIPVDHAPAPVAIKDFMHEPGAPTSYKQLAQCITKQFHLAEFTRVFDRCIASTHYLRPEDGDIISWYQCENRLITADTWNLAYTIAEIGCRLFIAFYTTPETIPRDDSDIDIIYVKTKINPKLSETRVTTEPDPDAALEDPLQSTVPIACEVIDIDENNEDEELPLGAAPVNDDELELLPITHIATPSTADIPPMELVDLDFEVENIENIKQNDAHFNMAVTNHEEGTGHDVESQTLKNEMMNNIH